MIEASVYLENYSRTGSSSTSNMGSTRTLDPPRRQPLLVCLLLVVVLLIGSTPGMGPTANHRRDPGRWSSHGSKPETARTPTNLDALYYCNFRLVVVAVVSLGRGNRSINRWGTLPTGCHGPLSQQNPHKIWLVVKELDSGSNWGNLVTCDLTSHRAYQKGICNYERLKFSIFCATLLFPDSTPFGTRSSTPPTTIQPHIQLHASTSKLTAGTR